MNDKIVSAQGENLSLVNVKGSKLNALSVYGKSTQDGTPTPDNPVPIVSAGDSGEINVTVSGKNLLNIGTVTFEKNKNFPVNILAGTYTFSAEVESDDTDSNHCLVMFQKNQQRIGTLSVNRVGRSSATITLNENADEIFLYASVGLNESDGDTATFTDIQLEIGTVATAYEPYKTPQTITLSTPGGLPGIPVDSGGNYTDENGQQWVCDEVDFERGVYVQRVIELDFDGAETWSTWGVNNLTEGITGFYSYISSVLKVSVKAMLSNSLQYALDAWGGGANGINVSTPNENQYIICSVYNDCLDDISTDDAAIESWRNILNTNNLHVMLILQDPIETDLPAEEIAAYKALHTYTPNTSVGNDAEAGVKIMYREWRR